MTNKITQIFEDITNKFIETIENGLETNSIDNLSLLWLSLGQYQANFEAKSYTGINAINLNLIAFVNNYESNSWLTFKKSKELGASVKKGEKASKIIFAKVHEIEDEDGEKKSRVIYKYFNVFNASQFDNLPQEYYEKKKLYDTKFQNEDIQLFDNLIKPFEDKITYGSDEAFYHSSIDRILAPAKDQYPNILGFYSTIFHEIAHLTGHSSRLNRQIDNVENSSEYCFEELIAELTASFVLGHFGYIDTTFKVNASYLKRYLEIMKKDPKFLIKAASKAQKAADYIINQKEGR